jgi:hypothetical protein
MFRALCCGAARCQMAAGIHPFGMPGDGEGPLRPSLAVPTQPDPKGSIPVQVIDPLREFGRVAGRIEQPSPSVPNQLPRTAAVPNFIAPP